MKILEPILWHKMQNGIIEGEGVKHTKKYLKDIFKIYKANYKLEGIDDNTVMYEVYSYSEGKEVPGNLNWGLTVMSPVRINGECNMTKGHYHEDRNCVEYYFGISGEGLLLYMNIAGEMWAEKILPGSLHYIDGNLAHRLVNIGDSQLKVGACWPSSAGHNYEDVEKKEFPERIYKESGEIVFKDR
ncbi:glucose-6-phosphate isomerase [Clostridium estertheticum]|uniref:glucose-6-phosphate isomerase family protein n=1 Tax=Clostridium estertheticum TaxID=238834 RepID=UPI0013E933EA|nr:glucose-6-phosphate isomerase family protein [Clostridium estertheticum]MBZ9685465.1 glucose-6-phosphate isomerase [Clostridium estertheticum]